MLPLYSSTWGVIIEWYFNFTLFFISILKYVFLFVCMFHVMHRKLSTKEKSDYIVSTDTNDSKVGYYII